MKIKGYKLKHWGYFAELPVWVRPKGHFSVWKLHHAYWGILLSAIGFGLIFVVDLVSWVPVAMIVMGGWLFLDDVIQHIYQRLEIRKVDAYHTVSLLNWLPNVIFKKNPTKGKHDANWDHRA